MSRVLEFFREEARSCLAGLEAALQDDAVDGEALHRHARRLRGSAQMARQTEIQALAGEVEAAARALAAGERPYDATTQETLAVALNRLGTMVAEAKDPGESEEATEREGTQVVGNVQSLYEEATRIAEELAHAPEGEAAELTDDLRQALDALGAAAAEAGLEEASQLSGHARARLEASGANAVVTLMPTIREAMGVARGAELGSRSAPEETGEPAGGPAEPEPAPGEDVASADVGPRDVATHAESVGEGSVEAAGPSPEEGVVPIGELLYRGDRALERALELRELLEGHVGEEGEAREALDEVFDLIGLGRT